MWEFHFSGVVVLLGVADGVVLLGVVVLLSFVFCRLGGLDGLVFTIWVF
jgi:hypothetical protein